MDGHSPAGASGTADGGEPALELRGLTRRFGDTVAADGVDLRLSEGEFFTLLGPSGCGKTTVLRLVAGFETPDAGRVLFRGEDVTGRPARKRGFGMVFQDYALFPHLDVFENVAFGLRSRSRPEAEIGERVERALELVDLPGFGGRRVQELSGGQQQRVALARALAIEPPLLLLDEPLSNLDAALRERTRAELRALVKELGIAALFVTHDQEEAFELSDRIAVMRNGRVRQTGTPETLYDAPADPFVARFLGRGNRLPVTVETGRGGAAVVRLADGTRWPLPDAEAAGPAEAAGAAGAAGRAGAGGSAFLWVRPEALLLEREGGPGDGAPAGGGGAVGAEAGAAGAADAGSPPHRVEAGAVEGVVVARRFTGGTTRYRVRAREMDAELEVVAARGAAARGDRVLIRPRPGARLHLFPPDAGPW